MVILYTDRERSVIYNYETKSLEVVTLKSKYVIPIEILAIEIEKGNLGAKKDTPEELLLISSLLKDKPFSEPEAKRLIQKYNAKVVHNGAVKELTFKGLVTLAKNAGVPSKRIPIFISRVLGFLIQKYYKYGDIPSLKSIKDIIRKLSELELTLQKVESTVNETNETGNNFGI